METAQDSDSRERFTELAYSLLVGVLMACLAITLVQIGERISPTWDGSYLVLAGFVVSLESSFSHRARRGKVRSLLSPEWLLYRAAEWVILLAMVKLLPYLPFGLRQLLADLPLWRQAFWQNFFTSEYVLSVFVIFFVWVLSAEFHLNLADLADDATLPPGVMPLDSQRSRAQIRERIADRFMLIGAVLIVLTALLRVDWQTSLLPGRLPQGGGFNLVGYFLTGLVLLSLTYYSTLRVSWRQENIPFSREIPKRWLSYSFLLILIVAVVSSRLPTSYSVGLVAGLNYLLYLLIGLLHLLWYLMLLPFILLWALAARLFGLNSSAAIPPAPLENLPQPPGASPGLGIPWLEALKSLVFWAVFLGVIFFSVRHYLREHPELLAWVRSLRGLAWLSRFWRWLLQTNRQMQRVLREQLQTLLGERKPEIPAAGRWYINLHRLSEREQVMFYYRALLRRGGEQGKPRQPAETPLEYSETLSALPALQEDLSARAGVSSLTERFVDARYSQHEITPVQVSLARQHWQRVRAALRRTGVNRPRPGSPNG